MTLLQQLHPNEFWYVFPSLFLWERHLAAKVAFRPPPPPPPTPGHWPQARKDQTHDVAVKGVLTC